MNINNSRAKKRIPLLSDFPVVRSEKVDKPVILINDSGTSHCIIRERNLLRSQANVAEKVYNTIMTLLIVSDLSPLDQ